MPRLSPRFSFEVPKSDGYTNPLIPRLLVSCLLVSVPAFGASTWQPLGPAPNTVGQVEGITDGEVSGAIHAIAAHPSDASILYAGAVNGGIWKTTNATAGSPTWTELTDGFDSLAIGALEFDRNDATHQTLVAGTGSFSSLSGDGGAPVGILRTTDGGSTWTQIDGGGTLLGKRISGVAARGSTIVISVDFANPFTFDNIGIWRSTDTGASWTQIATGDGSTTGLPGGVTDDLVGDPSDDSRLFTSVIFADILGGVNGVYRSDDTGATWTKVSSAAMDALLTNSTSNVEFAVGASNNVFAGIVVNGQLAGLFRSGNGGTSWTALDLPGNGKTIHPGGQGGTHFSIVADPTDADIVYVGGDRQDLPFPNDVGANDFSGRLFRCDAGLAPGSQCLHLTHSTSFGPSGGGTANTSAPHADSREMVFDAGGDLVESDDGGIYRRTLPRSNTGDWFSINGNIQTAEFHGGAYDNVSGVPLAGAQDTGTSFQVAPGMTPWESLSTGDGGKVAIDDSGASSSIRYTSFQGLQLFRRSTFDAANNQTGFTFPALTVVGGGAALSAQFYTPVVLNSTDPTRLVIGGSNSVYESLDQGDTITEIGPGIDINGTFFQPILYGGGAGDDLLIVGSDSSLFRRTAPPPAPLSALLGYPGADTVRDLAMDPDAIAEIFSVDSGSVFGSTDTGDTWSDLTGNLGSLNTGDLRSLAFVPRTDDMLVLGTDRGVFASLRSQDFTQWQELGAGLPKAPVYELEYDAADDILLATTFGRGSWTLDAPALETPIFTDGFESGNVSAWSSSVGAN